MNGKVPQPELRKNPMEESIGFIRTQTKTTPMNVAMVGGGEACYRLLKTLDEERLQRLNMNILGVADENSQAHGIRYARELGLFTTSDPLELFALKGLNLIIELTGSDDVRAELLKKKPPGVSFIDHRAAGLIWDLVQMEMERAALERERQKYEEQLKTKKQVILDSLPYRIMVINLDKTVDTVNQTFLNEFKMKHEDVEGKYCYELRYAFDEPCALKNRACFIDHRLDEMKEKGLINTYQEYTDEKGNTRFDVVTVSPVFNEKKEIVQILEASREVTERVKLEREAEKSRTFFENVIKSTVDGIVVVDTKGNVLIFNEGMERLTGYSADEIINRGHLSTFYDIDTAKENMRKMRSDEYGPLGKLNPTSMTITTKEGEEIPVTLSASIIQIDGQERGSVGVFTDMREILKMRKDLEDAHLQLVQSEKIASVGRMAAGVAHEINNPLSGIMIYAELLREELSDDQQRRQDAQEIIDQTLRCKKIVAELLEFSRQTVGKVSSFNLGELINKTLSLLTDQAIFQDIRVKKEVLSDLPEMVGDKGQLQQVFTNLFINAADAMQGKGMLTVRANYEPKANVFEINVSDTGPGIPEALRDKIFDIFFTTKPVGKGTGLGLSISKKIIELHGGGLAVESPPEGGTTFTIELPLGFIQQPSEEESVFIQ